MFLRCYRITKNCTQHYNTIHLLRITDNVNFSQNNRNYHLILNKQIINNRENVNKKYVINTTSSASTSLLLRFASTNQILPAIPNAPVIPSGTAVDTLTTATTTVTNLQIPDAPAIPIEDIAGDLLNSVSTIAANGEPTFASLGLGGWSPIGIVQNCFEYLHVTCDLPWWCAILIGTIVVRTLIFPLVILSQRNAAKMNNNLPQMQILQLKMTEARQSGNALESARYGQEMVQFMKEKELNPFKNLIVPLAQAPLFISFFIGLRRMANTPVDSLREGGLFWFTDLTMSDPLFLLPLITSATLWLTIEIGTDSAKLSAQNLQTMRYVLRAMPIIIFPFTMNFPAAILLYWTFSNFISLGQVSILKIPAVRDYFKIDRLIEHKQDTLPVKPKKFVQGLKESWQNMKISKELEARERVNDISFQRAGRGPLIKTYKHDPTMATTSNRNISSQPIEAKKR